MSETKIIDGKAIAAALRAKIAAEVKMLGFQPGLAVVLVGEDAASHVYVNAKTKACVEAGMKSFDHRLSANVSQAELLALIAKLNADENVHGILVQLPLPKHIDEKAVLLAVLPEKDVDGFHPINVGKLWSGDEALTPCTPRGCTILLKQTLGDLTGKHAVVIGRSNIVGKPVSALLLRENCTVTIAHSKTQNLPDVVRQGDIVIAAVGKAEMVRGSWIKKGAAVIDVGINRVNGKLLGDVAFNECLGIAGAITPVPGGVGPMTIACLLENTLKAAKGAS
jgi:methylenetetrahydrofolate dehydrogenase (NADP+)/methenyltetrahydrofolate cyclohydrolase